MFAGIFNKIFTRKKSMVFFTPVLPITNIDLPFDVFVIADDSHPDGFILEFRPHVSLDPQPPMLSIG